MQTTAQIESKDYTTADLYFAAFLIVAGVEVKKLVKSKEERRVYYHFLDEGQIDDLRVGYYQRKVKIEALPFTQEIKNLKNQTHEIMKGAR